MATARFEIAFGDERYPAQLAASPRPPRALYGFGDPDALQPGLAIIGARKATPYGLQASALFAGWAASLGHVVVSGGAIGCDQAAHRAALSAGGRTVAVLGCGADVAYPSGSEDLFERIAEGGAVISEYPWGTRPRRWAFAERNRIIAWLASAVLVTEAGLPSGTFSTADFALEASREVLVVPGSIFAPECAGANRLLRQGASPITQVSDLTDELGCLLGQAADAPVAAGPPDVGSPSPLLAALRTNPMRPDDIASWFGLDVVSVVRDLSMLEARGLVVRYRDGRYGWPANGDGRA